MTTDRVEFEVLRQIDSINQCMNSGWLLYLNQIRSGDEFGFHHWIRIEKIIDAVEDIADGDGEITSKDFALVMIASNILHALDQEIVNQRMYFNNIIKLIHDLSHKLASMNHMTIHRDRLLNELTNMFSKVNLATETISSIESNQRTILDYRSIVNRAILR